MPESTLQIQVERTLKRHSVRGQSHSVRGQSHSVRGQSHSVRGQSGNLTGKPPGCRHQRKKLRHRQNVIDASGSHREIVQIHGACVALLTI
jgi:hypothetical protein